MRVFLAKLAFAKSQSHLIGGQCFPATRACEMMIIMSLAQKHCVPCRGGVPPLKGAELENLKTQVPGWQVVEEHHLTRTYTFPDFLKALDFVNRAGAIAEQEGHHPDLFLSWGKVSVKIWTHKIDGLTESDFILAAKIDQIPQN
jgi:4a-hydroxytetrahydrobiopterin dehydratase